jgi:hypothetical protein
MKKTLLLFLMPIFGMSQNQFAFGFDGTTAAMITAGWQSTNQSSPAGASTWIIPSDVPTAASPFGGLTRAGQAGGTNSFVLVNFNSTTGAGTISNWLISPVINVQNGDIVTFYTRIGKNTTGADPNASFADRLQFRMSTNGATTVNPTGGSAGLGDFTTLLVDVNPALNLTAYPTSWAAGQQSVTISGLAGPTNVKFAFRYFVTNGGPSGANSDIIGVDTFSVDRPLSTDSFFKNNFSVYPNPVNDVVNISSLNNSEITKVSITDINGRVVKEINSNVATVSVGDLTAGIYFLKINTLEGVGTTKFVKN